METPHPGEHRTAITTRRHADAGITPEHLIPAYDRARDHTAPSVNARIDARIRGELQRMLDTRDRDALVRRLTAIEREWDVDRAMLANFATFGGLTFGLGLLQSHKWLYLFGAQLGFLLMHAVSGWCPPASLFRRLGVRTQQEIAVEKRLLARLLEQRTQASDS